MYERETFFEPLSEPSTTTVGPDADAAVRLTAGSELISHFRSFPLEATSDDSLRRATVIDYHNAYLQGW